MATTQELLLIGFIPIFILFMTGEYRTQFFHPTQTYLLLTRLAVG